MKIFEVAGVGKLHGLTVMSLDAFVKDDKKEVEEAVEGRQKHKVAVTVSDPNHSAVSQRGETRQRMCSVTADGREQACDTAVNWYKKQGYRVHDHNYVGTVEDTVKEGLKSDLHLQFADVYDELAPGIEKYKDSVKAGQLYDALKLVAEKNGAVSEFKRMMMSARYSAHQDYDTNPGGFENWFWYLPFGDKLAEASKTRNATRDFLRNNPVSPDQMAKPVKQMSVPELATVSDEALDNAYHYGRSTPGNTFGWQANLKSAAYAKLTINKGITDIEQISDAIHKGWNVTARAFVQNPDQFDDTEKLKAAGKLEAKLQQRAKLMNIEYAQLPDDEQEKDRVVARALLQAIKGQQGVAEGLGYSRDPAQAKWYHEGRKAFKGGTTGNLIQDIAKKHGVPSEWIDAFRAGYQDQEGFSKDGVAEGKMADKDYDKDGKIETGSKEHAGAVDKAIKDKAVKDKEKEDDELAEMMRLSGVNVDEDKLAKKDYDKDGKIETGSKEHAGAVDKAIERNQVTDEEKVDECMGSGMMSPVPGQAMGQSMEQEGNMNITTNMSSDGTKSVSISADGEAAVQLMQMLKLAGMGGQGPTTPQAEPEVAVVSAEAEAEVDEEKDPRYQANTSPEEHVMPIQALTKGGDGDVAGKEKAMTPNGYQFGDNPRAMREAIQGLDNFGHNMMKEYESIKIKK